MIKRRLYYALKPLVPWTWRNALRRRSARTLLERTTESWPILPDSHHPPAGWNGWPDGKKFAVVFTHDVEDQIGLSRCSQLLDFEQEQGMRSSFNFIPEGPYRVSQELRAAIELAGSEVGVHDLAHDGTLFNGYSAFQQRAQRINHYLREWNAVGFRSGFMLRQLDWMHHLDVQYDLSTFDTDPFEMQPEGVGTIFPYWLPSPAGLQEGPDAGPSAQSRGGFWELPYTLPQDSTLFQVLEHRDCQVWKDKADWIAEHGGMVLVNIHPDYINFENRQTPREYPLAFIRDFWDHLNRHHPDQFWNPTPRELVGWLQNRRPAADSGASAAFSPEALHRLKGKRAAVLLYSNYPFDPRPRRAAEAMAEAGMTVDLHSLGDPDAKLPRREFIKGVRLSRVVLKHQRGSKLTYLWQYSRFLLSCLWFLSRKGLWHRYDIVHVHNMPDILVFAALVPKLRRAGIILDLHDPMPELMTCIYGLKPDSPFVRLLRLFEKASIGFADLVLTPNQAFKDVFTSRSCTPDKMHIVMNCPEESVFHPDLPPLPLVDAESSSADAFRVMHHGSILHRHGLDLLVEAIARVRQRIPHVQLELYGRRDPFLDQVLERAKELGVEDIVHYHGAKTQPEIARIIRSCSVGVVPNRLSSFTAINLPTRLFEYLAMRCPVIAPDTRGIGDYFNEDQMLKFTPEDVDDLAAKIIWVHDNPAAAAALVEAGIEVYRQHLWSREKLHFLGLVNGALKL